MGLSHEQNVVRRLSALRRSLWRRIAVGGLGLLLLSAPAYAQEVKAKCEIPSEVGVVSAEHPQLGTVEGETLQNFMAALLPELVASDGNVTGWLFVASSTALIHIYDKEDGDVIMLWLAADGCELARVTAPRQPVMDFLLWTSV